MVNAIIFGLVRGGFAINAAINTKDFSRSEHVSFYFECSIFYPFLDLTGAGIYD